MTGNRPYPGHRPRFRSSVARDPHVPAGHTARLVHATLSPAIRATLALAPRFRPATSAAFHIGAYLGRRAPAYLGRLPSGSRIVLDLAEWAHRQIFFYGTYEEPTTAFLWRLSRPGWTFIDIGANVGYFSLLAADLGGPASTVVAFEPNPRLAGMLRESVRLSGHDARVSVIEAACSSISSTATLSLSPDPRNSGLSSFESFEPSVTASWERPGAVVQVKTTRLDEWCASEDVVPDVVKVDVEGHELAVVEGMTGLFERGQPQALICELSGDPRRPHAAAVLELLSTFDYRAFHIAGGGLQPVASLDDVSDLENICFLAPQGGGEGGVQPLGREAEK